MSDDESTAMSASSSEESMDECNNCSGEIEKYNEEAQCCSGEGCNAKFCEDCYPDFLGCRFCFRCGVHLFCDSCVCRENNCAWRYESFSKSEKLLCINCLKK